MLQYIKRPIERRNAKQNGDKYYFTGRECLAGHIAKRYVSTGKCSECCRVYDRVNYNLEKRREANRRYFAKDPKRKLRHLMWQREYREKHPEKIIAKRERDRAYCQVNKTVRVGQRDPNTRRRKLVKFASVSWANREAMAAIYAEARRLTKETGIKHAVDHVIPLRGRNVCGLHVETNMRVITQRENIRKGNRWYVA